MKERIFYFDTIAQRNAVTLEKPYMCYIKESDTIEYGNENIVEFADSKTKEAIINKFDTEGKGFVLYNDLAKVNNSMFAEIEEGSLGSSFDEFQYFIGVTKTPRNSKYSTATFTGYGCFKAVNNITLPSSLETIDRYAFQGTTSALRIKMNEGLREISNTAFIVNGYSTYTTGPGEHEDTGYTYNASYFGGVLTFPSTLERIGLQEESKAALLNGASKWVVFRFKSPTPPVLNTTLPTVVSDSHSVNHILVPEGSLEAYQNAEGWSNYASAMNVWNGED
jgi:hypothetical protein